MSRTVDPRFWDKVEKGPGCWNWSGRVGRKGYGQFGNGRSRSTLVHKIAYEAIRGPVPDGLELDHLCRNRRCVNPDHLEPVTHRENVLRGDGLAAKNARKTLCFKCGATLGGENAVSTKDRSCRRCAFARQAEWKRAKRRDMRAAIAAQNGRLNDKP